MKKSDTSKIEFEKAEKPEARRFVKKFDTSMIVYIGVLTAMEIVLNRFLSINAWNLKIGFSFVPVAIAGMLFGRHKLAPVISQHKTIEGVIGGVIASILAMVIYAVVLQFNRFDVNYINAILYGVFGSLVGSFGEIETPANTGTRRWSGWMARTPRSSEEYRFRYACCSAVNGCSFLKMR